MKKMCQNGKLPNAFVIFVDRIEGKYAVCEMPDETMCDIEISRFPGNVKERERFLVSINSAGNFEIINRLIVVPENKPILPKKLIRF